MKVKKEFNVRIIETDKGYKLGFVWRLADRKNFSEWVDASNTDRKKLEEQLNK